MTVGDKRGFFGVLHWKRECYTYEYVYSKGRSALVVVYQSYFSLGESRRSAGYFLEKIFVSSVFRVACLVGRLRLHVVVRLQAANLSFMVVIRLRYCWHGG